MAEATVLWDEQNGERYDGGGGWSQPHNWFIDNRHAADARVCCIPFQLPAGKLHITQATLAIGNAGYDDYDAQPSAQTTVSLYGRARAEARRYTTSIPKGARSNGIVMQNHQWAPRVFDVTNLVAGIWSGTVYLHLLHELAYRPSQASFLGELGDVRMTVTYTLITGEETNMGQAMIMRRSGSVPVRLPGFSYEAGTYQLVKEGRDWKIRFLTSGVLTFFNDERPMDVFLVGGGGSGSSRAGAGGGYTNTVRGFTPQKDTPYQIQIGQGATARTNAGGVSSAFGFTAAGGKAHDDYKGGEGGSGGGGYGLGTTGNYNGGSDGSDGFSANSTYPGGKGQGTTTREFAEATGDLYGGGGAGMRSSDANPAYDGVGGAGGGGNVNSPGTPNTGGGAGGRISGGPATIGGSGIVIIRNARG